MRDHPLPKNGLSPISTNRNPFRHHSSCATAQYGADKFHRSIAGDVVSRSLHGMELFAFAQTRGIVSDQKQ